MDQWEARKGTWTNGKIGIGKWTNQKAVLPSQLTAATAQTRPLTETQILSSCTNTNTCILSEKCLKKAANS